MKKPVSDALLLCALTPQVRVLLVRPSCEWSSGAPGAGVPLTPASRVVMLIDGSTHGQMFPRGSLVSSAFSRFERCLASGLGRGWRSSCALIAACIEAPQVRNRLCSGWFDPAFGGSCGGTDPHLVWTPARTRSDEGVHVASVHLAASGPRHVHSK